MLSTSIEYPMEHSNDFALLHLHSGQSLFRFSDPKKFTYRVLRGGLALYQPRPPHSDEPIRFAFPGDVVGLGFLAHHVEHALAIADSIFACLPGEQLKALLARDERVRDELDAATDREFEYQRKSCVERIFTPVARTATFFWWLQRTAKQMASIQRPFPYPSGNSPSAPVFAPTRWTRPSEILQNAA